MSPADDDSQSERTRLRRESRTWRLIPRTLLLGRSIGSLFYLISAGLIASWVIAVFFGVGLFFLMPRSAKLASGASPASPDLTAPLAETPWLMQSTNRLDRLSTLPPSGPSQPMGDAAADKARPVIAPGRQSTADVNPRPAPDEPTIAHAVYEPQGQALSVEPGAIPTAIGEAAPMPAPQGRLSAPPEPRGSSRPNHPASSRKPPERRTANTRTAKPHAAVSAIQDVLQKHSGLLK